MKLPFLGSNYTLTSLKFEKKNYYFTTLKLLLIWFKVLVIWLYIFVKTMQSKIIIKFFEWSMYTKYYIFILKVKGVIFSYSGNYTKDFFFFFFHKWNKSFTIAKRKKKKSENAKWILRLFFFFKKQNQKRIMSLLA